MIIIIAIFKTYFSTQEKLKCTEQTQLCVQFVVTNTVSVFADTKAVKLTSNLGNATGGISVCLQCVDYFTRTSSRLVSK